MSRPKKNYLTLKAREAVLSELSKRKIKTDIDEIEGFLDYVAETAPFKKDIKISTIKRKVSMGKISKDRFKSIEKGLELQEEFKRRGSKFGTIGGVFEATVENEWKQNNKVRKKVQRVLDDNGGTIPDDTSNGLANDADVINAADKLGMDTMEFIGFIFKGAKNKTLKQRGRRRKNPIW